MGGIRSAPTYIYRHTSSYIVRITIPPDIVPSFRKKEFRYSLRTGSLDVAKYRSRMIVGMVQRVFIGIRRGGQMAELTEKQLNEMIRKYIGDLLKEDEEDRLMRPKMMDEDEPFYQRSFYSDFEAKARKQLAMNDFSRVSQNVDELLDEHGIHINKDTFEYRKVCSEMLKAMRGFYEVLMRRAVGEDDFPAEAAKQKPERDIPKHIVLKS